MENEKPKKLYPLHFEPVTEQMPWGTQTWVLADLGFVNSEITQGWLAGNTMEDLMETYIDRAVGEACYQYYGRQFPVAVRCLDIQGQTPLEVHPDDLEAMHRYDALGKAQLLYIVEAGEDAQLFLGFNREMNAQELYVRSLDGSIMEDLHMIRPKAGEYYLVKPGLVNAFSGHLKVVVIQESSDVNLILCDPGHTAGQASAFEAAAAAGTEGPVLESAIEEMRMTHLSEAIDLIDFRPYETAILEKDEETEAEDSERKDEKKPTDPSTELLTARPEFTISRIRLHDPLEMNLEHLGCFLIYTCIEGAASIQIPSVNERNEKCMENYEFKAGETVLVPAEVPGFFLVPRDRDTVLLETIVESHEEVDSYINPNTEPFLEGEDYEGLENGEFDEDEEGECCCGHDHDGEGCHCHEHGKGSAEDLKN